MVIEQKLTLMNDFRLLKQIQFDFNTDFSINFSLNTNFKNKPYKMCIKMSQNKFYLRYLKQNFNDLNFKNFNF